MRDRVTVRTLRPRLNRLCLCGSTAFAVMAVVAEIDECAAFASADEAMKPTEASVNTSTSNFFIILSSTKNQSGYSHNATVTPFEVLDLLIDKMPIKRKWLHEGHSQDRFSSLCADG